MPLPKDQSSFAHSTIDEHVFRADAGFLSEQLGDFRIERLLLIKRPSCIQGDLDEHNVVGAADAEVGGVVDQSFSGMIRDYLKAVVLGHVDSLPHGAVDHVSDLGAIFRGLSLTQVDANERHERIIPGDA